METGYQFSYRAEILGSCYIYCIAFALFVSCIGCEAWMPDFSLAYVVEGAGRGPNLNVQLFKELPYAGSSSSKTSKTATSAVFRVAQSIDLRD